MKPAIIVAAIMAILAGLIIVNLNNKLADERAAHSKTQVEYSNYRTEVNRLAREAMEADRAKEANWRKQIKDLDNQWSNEYAILSSKYDKLDGASRRMSSQLATFTAASKDLASTATTAAEREAVAASFDLLSDMYRELGERETTLAKALDRSHGEGKACEKFFEVTD
jgi:chromosome segregation ATPase